MFLRSLLIVFMAIFISPVNFAQADEVDNMVNTLNQKLAAHDWSGFGDEYAKSAERGGRFKNTDYKTLGKKTATALAAFSTIGKTIGYSIVKNERCGEHIRRILSVFIAEEGQFYVVYWFFRTEKEWSLAVFDGEAESSTKPFTKKLKEELKVSC